MTFGGMQYSFSVESENSRFWAVQSRAVFLVKQTQDNNLFFGLFCIVLRPNLDERQLQIKTDLANVK